MSTSPEDTVRAAEAAYNSGDIEAVLALFADDVVFHENGKLVGKGIDDIRRWHEKFFAAVVDFRLAKRLRLAEGSVIGVQYRAEFRTRSGKPMESFGGEFWTMADDRLVEWHMYWSAYPLEA